MKPLSSGGSTLTMAARTDEGEKKKKGGGKWLRSHKIQRFPRLSLTPKPSPPTPQNPMRLRRRPSRSPSPPPPPRPRAWADVAASLVAARRSYSDLATASDAAVTAAKGAAKDAGVALRAAAADAAAAARAEHERVSAALRAAADRAAASPSGLEGFDRVLALAQASMSGGGVAGDGGERARVGAPSRARRGAGPRGPRRARTALTPPAADDLWSVLDSTLGLKSGGGGRGKAGGTVSVGGTCRRLDGGVAASPLESR